MPQKKFTSSFNTLCDAEVIKTHTPSKDFNCSFEIYLTLFFAVTRPRPSENYLTAIVRTFGRILSGTFSTRKYNVYIG
jgi:hypothetical protein